MSHFNVYQYVSNEWVTSISINIWVIIESLQCLSICELQISHFNVRIESLIDIDMTRRNVSCLWVTSKHMWDLTHLYVTWLILICNVSRSYMTWLMHLCDMNSFWVLRCVTFMCVRWLIHMWHDSFICVTWLIHMCDMTDSYVTWLIHMRDVTHSCVWHDSFICDMTHSYVWHDSFICVTW